jgi:antitoxin CptB
MQTDLPNTNKLKWMCRRGLLELDLVLTKILDEKYDDLTQQQKKLFIELLEEPDTDLLAWLLNQTLVPSHWNSDMVELVKALR